MNYNFPNASGKILKKEPKKTTWKVKNLKLA